jgi:uncharacterized protein YbbK (DUF523 family)
MGDKIKVGISACLLGKNVRYNGKNKLDTLIADLLGQYVEFVHVCPEAEAGLGVPREPMTLKGSPDSPRMVTTETGIDITNRILEWTKNQLELLEKENLRGFIFKTKSPSCQLEGAKGGGIFARAFMKRFPHIPVTDEAKFRDGQMRESFIKRIKRGI